MSSGRSLTARRGRSLVALASVLAVILAACGGGDDALPEDPQEAVVQAFQNRFDAGTTVSATLRVTDAGRQAFLADTPEAEVASQEKLLDVLTAEDALTLTVRDDQVGFALGLGEDRPVQIRSLGDAFYVLLDIPALLDFFEADMSAEDLALPDEASAVLGDLTALWDAMREGRWAGITEIPDDATKQINEVLSGIGGPVPTPDPTEAREAASELGLASPSQFVERYVEVEEGEEGDYVGTLRLRALVRAFAEAGQGLAPPGAGGALSDQDLQDVPETVGGVGIEVDGDQVSAVTLDVHALGQALAENPEEDITFEEGDIVVRLDFAEVDGALLEAPEEAETATFEDVLDVARLVAGLAERFMGSLDQAPGAGGSPTSPRELPSGLEIPTPTAVPDGPRG